MSRNLCQRISGPSNVTLRILRVPCHTTSIQFGEIRLCCVADLQNSRFSPDESKSPEFPSAAQRLKRFCLPLSGKSKFHPVSSRYLGLTQISIMQYFWYKSIRIIIWLNHAQMTPEDNKALLFWCVFYIKSKCFTCILEARKLHRQFICKFIPIKVCSIRRKGYEIS